MTYGTDSDGTYFEGYAYEATTSGSNYGTTAEKKTRMCPNSPKALYNNSDMLANHFCWG